MSTKLSRSMRRRGDRTVLFTAWEELKARIVELRSRGHAYTQIADILNEQKWVPLKGRKFTK